MEIIDFGLHIMNADVSPIVTVRQRNAKGKVLVCLNRNIPKGSYLEFDNKPEKIPVIPLKPLFINIDRFIVLNLMPMIYAQTNMGTFVSPSIEFAVFDEVNEYLYFTENYYKNETCSVLSTATVNPFEFKMIMPISKNNILIGLNDSGNCASVSIKRFIPTFALYSTIGYMTIGLSTRWETSFFRVKNEQDSIHIEKIYKKNLTNLEFKLDFE